MAKYLIDFETRSDLDISVGTEKYLRTPNSDIICMSWKKWGEKTRLWIPPMLQPFHLGLGDKIYAFNIQFDQRVWNVLGRKYHFESIHIENCIDVMALAGRYTFPQSLDFLGRVLKLPVQKSSRGKALMKKICAPPFKYTKEELNEFYAYCMDDVNTMYEAIKALPSDILHPDEQKIWQITVDINRRGLPVDTNLAARVLAVTDYYKKQESKKLPILTNDAVHTVGQVAAIRKWAEGDHGVILENLQADTVSKAIEDESIPTIVKKVLRLRQDLGQTSIAKYKRIIEQSINGRIYDNLRYYGASTGRWAGLGFQVHNLPRATVEDIEDTIKKFYDTTILSGDPMYAAKALIRSVITPPEGYVIIAADYSAIEDMLLIWLTDEQEHLANVRKGLDRYKLMAQTLYQIPYEEIDDYKRFLGKTLVLGAGYNLGGPGYLEYAKGYGIEDLTEAQAISAIKTYRRTHPNIKDFWYDISECAVNATTYHGQEFELKRCTFKRVVDRTGRPWLRLELPSGRALFYCEPEVKPGKYGPIVTHMGINSYNKQWQRLKLIPGRITENIIQALARDILVHGKQNVLDEMYYVIVSIHDEIICEEEDRGVEENNAHLTTITSLMCDLPDWAHGLPLKASGQVLRRYRKL